MPFSVTRLFEGEEGETFQRGLEDDPQWSGPANWVPAIGVSAIAVATFIGASGSVDRPWLLGLLLALTVVPFVAECRYTVPVPAMVIACLVPMVLLHLFGGPLGVYEHADRGDQASLFILTWLVGQTTAVGKRRDIVAVVVIGLAITGGRALVDEHYGAWPIWSASIFVALLAGLFIRALILAIANERRAQDALARQAAVSERQRIAREIHDVIAHSLTVTMLHLTAARLAVGRGDSAGATEALEEAERAGRTSLAEIRQTVGLLRENDPTADEAPQPAAVDVPALVASFAGAGMSVSLDLDGELEGVDRTTGLAVYRIVQESLSNAARHSPGATSTVRIVTGPPLHVEVTTAGGVDTRDPGSGSGIDGMIERARALGGTLDARRTARGWDVKAVLP